MGVTFDLYDIVAVEELVAGPQSKNDVLVSAGIITGALNFDDALVEIYDRICLTPC